MATLGDIKTLVSDHLDAGDGTVSIPVRDRLINQARRKFYSERQWDFLFKTATLTFTTYLASLPTDYNKKFDPIQVYTYSGNVKYEYRKVPYDELSSYNTSAYVYAIDKPTGKIKINQTASTLTIDYTHLPADAPITTGQDATAEMAADITPIGYLSIAMYWLSKERKPDMHKIFMDLYREELSHAIAQNSTNQPIRFSRNNYTYPSTGYTGRH